MPIYEYKCRECGEIAEFRITSQSQVGLLICKKCGSQNMDRLISIPSIFTGRSASSGHTCCGKTERCEKPPCSDGGRCGRH